MDASRLSPTADRVLEVKIGGLKPRIDVRSGDVDDLVCKVDSNKSSRIPFSRSAARHSSGRDREPGREKANGDRNFVSTVKQLPVNGCILYFQDPQHCAWAL